MERRALQVLLSISAFSLLLASFSWFSPSHLLLSSLVSSFFISDYVDKNMVFLLCNGIILCVSVLPGTRSFSPQNLQLETTKLQSKPSFVKIETGVEIIALEVGQEQIQGEEEEEEREIEGVLVPEQESDERFEDFIRKMREQMGIASQMIHGHAV